MIEHVVLPKKEVEITSGYAGAEGNSIWFNTGNCALLLRLVTGGESESTIIEQGFGFCMGKKEKLTYIFSVYRAVDKSEENDPFVNSPQAMLFACDGGDQTSWLGELDSVVPEIWFKNRGNELGSHQ